MPVDKQTLYGEFERRQKWRENLAKKGAHKALDIPLDDDMNMNVRNGIGWKELLVIFGFILGTGGLTGWLLSQQQEPPALPEAPPFEIPADSDTLFELHLGDKTS